MAAANSSLLKWMNLVALALTVLVNGWLAVRHFLGVG